MDPALLKQREAFRKRASAAADFEADVKKQRRELMKQEVAMAAVLEAKNRRVKNVREAFICCCNIRFPL